MEGPHQEARGRARPGRGAANREPSRHGRPGRPGRDSSSTRLDFNFITLQKQFKVQSSANRQEIKLSLQVQSCPNLFVPPARPGDLRPGSPARRPRPARPAPPRGQLGGSAVPGRPSRSLWWPRRDTGPGGCRVVKSESSRDSGIWSKSESQQASDHDRPRRGWEEPRRRGSTSQSKTTK